MDEGARERTEGGNNWRSRDERGATIDAAIGQATETRPGKRRTRPSKADRTSAERERDNAKIRAQRLAKRIAKLSAPDQIRDRVSAGFPLPGSGFGKPVTRKEAETLAEVIVHGDQARAAECLDISIQTLKNQLTDIYVKTGAISDKNAAFLMGWVLLPKGLLKPHRAPREEYVVPDLRLIKRSVHG